MSFAFVLYGKNQVPRFYSNSNAWTVDKAQAKIWASVTEAIKYMGNRRRENRQEVLRWMSSKEDWDPPVELEFI